MLCIIKWDKTLSIIREKNIAYANIFDPKARVAHIWLSMKHRNPQEPLIARDQIKEVCVV